MYASLLMSTLGPGMDSTAEKLVDQFAPVARTQKGLKGITFFGDDTVGEYGSLTIYESKEDAEDAIAATDPHLEQALRAS
jgi:hypothetical protein